MLGAKHPGHSLGMPTFIVLRLAKADGECLDRPIREPCHERHDDRAIDAAGEERAKRHVTDQARAHAACEYCLQFIEQILLWPVAPGDNRLDLERAPVGSDARLPLVEFHPMPRRQFADR